MDDHQAAGAQHEEPGHPWDRAVGSRLYQRPVEAVRAVFGHLDPDDRLVYQLVDDVIHGAPSVQMHAVRRLTDELLPRRLDAAVIEGRRLGMTWTGIGRVLGISRQAVQQRFGRASL